MKEDPVNPHAVRRLVFHAAVALKDALAHAARRQRLCSTAVAEWASAVEEAERCASELKKLLVRMFLFSNRRFPSPSQPGRNTTR